MDKTIEAMIFKFRHTVHPEFKSPQASTKSLQTLVMAMNNTLYNNKNRKEVLRIMIGAAFLITTKSLSARTVYDIFQEITYKTDDGHIHITEEYKNVIQYIEGEIEKSRVSCTV